MEEIFTDYEDWFAIEMQPGSDGLSFFERFLLACANKVERVPPSEAFTKHGEFHARDPRPRFVLESSASRHGVVTGLRATGRCRILAVPETRVGPHVLHSTIPFTREGSQVQSLSRPPALPLDPYKYFPGVPATAADRLDSRLEHWPPREAAKKSFQEWNQMAPC